MHQTMNQPSFVRRFNRQQKALSESKKGVEVSASWGGAMIPQDATDPLAALQLADVRMYAQKESRRAAHGSSIELSEISPSQDPSRA